MNVAKAQSKDSKMYYDIARTMHFGFTIGTNLATFKYSPSASFYDKNPDTFQNIYITRSPGITLGAVADLHFGSSYIGEHFDLRAIPTLVLASRRANYVLKNDKDVIFKDVESAIVCLPILLKFKTDRYNKVRIYTIGGINYGYDLSSNAKSNKKKLESDLAVKPINFNYEYGLGLDIYFPYFKFSPEIKWSKSFNNIQAPNGGIYSNVFDGMRSKIVFLSLYFEG